MGNASIACFVGIVLSWWYTRWWILFSFGVLAFLAMHAVQGYCPPAIWFRAAGWRTAGEIEDEAAALRLIHGRVAPSLNVGEQGKKKLVDELVSNKRERGSFLGEAPEKIAERGEKIAEREARIGAAKTA